MAVPTQDQALRDWADNFGTRITATPLVFNLTAGMATEFDTRASAFDSALAEHSAAREAGVRSEPLTAAKQTAKASLIEYARDLYRTVQGAPGLSDEAMLELGVSPPDRVPTPVNAPAAAPAVSVISVFGRQVRLSIKDASGTRKGRPLYVAGASLFSFIGPTPPAGTEGWQAEGNITKNQILVQFDEDVAPGTKVWFTAFWYTQRGLSGPACTPVGSMIGSEGAEPLAA